MPEAQPPLPPKKEVPGWKLATLWLLPAVSILLMIPAGLYWMVATRGEKMVLIVAVFGVIQIVLLSILAEIHGRLRAATLRAGGRDPIAARKFHSRLYFVAQLVLAPLLAFLIVSVLAWLRSM